MNARLSDRIWSIINLLGTLGVITVNALANILPLNGVNTGVLSDDLPNLFVPAGLTFSIWGVIYLLMLWYATASLVDAFKGGGNASAESPRASRAPDWIRRTGPWYLASSLANMAWIFAWHWRLLPLSMGIMVVLLISLIGFYLESRRVSANLAELSHPSLSVRLPASVYLGWITVATAANATGLLVHLGFTGGSLAGIFALGVLGAVLVLGIIFIVAYGDLGYTLVLLWALTGIAIKRLGGDNPASPEVGIAALVVGAILLVLYLLRLLKIIR